MTQSTEPTMLERDNLLRNAAHDAQQAIDCIFTGDWLRAHVLLSLAADQIEDAGIIP